MKEFGYSSAAAVSLLVVSAGLSLAAVIANLPLLGEPTAKGSWAPGSDSRVATAVVEALPIEDSFQVSFDPGADLVEPTVVAETPQEEPDTALYTIHDEQIVALAEISPAAGSSPPAVVAEALVPVSAAVSLPVDAPLRRSYRVSQEPLERREVAPPKAVSLALADRAATQSAKSAASAAAAPALQIALTAATDEALDAALAAKPEAAPVTGSSLPENQAETPAGPAGYVVIGSFLRPEIAAAHALKHQDWRPTILAGKVDGKIYQRVVVGPFSKADLPAALQRIVGAGIADAWRLPASGQTDLALRRLDSLS